MRILILGGSGMLGHKLVHKWSERFELWTTLRSELHTYDEFKIYNKQNTFQNINVEDINSVEKVIRQVKPDVIINAVGLIKQLPTANNVIQMLIINSIFPNQLTELARKYRARLITISTDCVFRGDKGNYLETDESDARDLYGKSKNLGEIIGENCLTIRTSIIGRELKTAHSLVEWFLANRGGKVKGFVNAVYSGFPTVIMADILSDIITNHQELSGLYHISSDPINKFELLQLINEAYNSRTEIEMFEDFKIDRSLDSTKFRKTTGFSPSSWREMVEQMAQDNIIYEK